MSSSTDRFYETRTPSTGDTQAGLFQPGQGGRTVLPPLSSAFPTSRFPVPHTYSNQYTQPRSSPGRNEYNTPSVYGQWPQTAPMQQGTTPFYYESADSRFTAQNTVTNIQSRVSPSIPSEPQGSRRLPPLGVSSSRDDRWQQAAVYANTPGLMSNMGTSIRSPTAAYPPAYGSYSNQGNTGYSYPDLRSLAPIMGPHSQPVIQMIPPSSVERSQPSRGAVRSPYARNHTSVSPPNFPPHLVSTEPTEEPTIKKKRKRADANQLKVLNEVYTRTAFPSTEERAELARKLEMSPRSVQIWFQNKRQSMRQTSRQTNNTVTSNSHQQFSLSPQDDPILDETHAVTGFEGSIPSVPNGEYVSPRLPSESSRMAALHDTGSPSLSQRLPRTLGEPESRRFRCAGF